MSQVMGVTKFERFFREEASLNVDKQDVKRYKDSLNQESYDLLSIAQATAKANGRDVIAPFDLPITKGLQEWVHDFAKMKNSIEVKPILEQILARPPLDPGVADETAAKLPQIAGGMSVALARRFRILDPDLENPGPEEWGRAFKLFNLLL